MAATQSQRVEKELIAMDKVLNPAFPAGNHLNWRPLAPADLPALAELTVAVLAADGGLPLAATPELIRSRYLSGPAEATLGGFNQSGFLVAATAARLAETDELRRALIAGQVHPERRRQGLGTFLLGWGLAAGRALLAGTPSDRPRALCVASESLGDAAVRLYQQHGLAHEFGELVMRRELAALPEATPPLDITLETWAPELAEQFFAAYDASFRERPGFPGWSAAEWTEWATEDDEFLPGASLLARRGGEPVGFVVCSAGWIVQVGVRPQDRGRGLGAALVAEALRRLRTAGMAEVLLDVNVNNPRAARLYERLGFEVIGRRARYSAPA
jgi:mycothiol synthase